MDTARLYQVDREVDVHRYRISTDRALLDLDVIHSYLYHSYWSPGVPREMVAQGIDHSLNFGLYFVHGEIPAHGETSDHSKRVAQVGFARVITDYASFAYLADVFVLPDHRGNGLGIWLIDTILACPQLQSLRSFSLATRDAHTLYSKFGFEAVDSTRYMVKRYEMPWRDLTLIQE